MDREHHEHWNEKFLCSVCNERVCGVCSLLLVPESVVTRAILVYIGFHFQGGKNRICYDCSVDAYTRCDDRLTSLWQVRFSLAKRN